MKIDGARLREARQRKMWNQRDLAREAGLAFETVSRLESGHQQPTMATLRRLVEVLGVDLDALLVTSNGRGDTEPSTTRPRGQVIAR